jgi:peptidoglycan/xylan/chitin deacetylase (PgdA/CDA1 family)
MWKRGGKNRSEKNDGVGKCGAGALSRACLCPFTGSTLPLVNAAFLLRPIVVALTSLLLCGGMCQAETPGSKTPGATHVLKWQDGKKACFMLAFDDGAPSQLKNVIPELEKRKIVGTFYLVTGNSLYAALKSKWEAAAKSPNVVVANHTFTHKGVTNAEELEPELAKNNEVLLALYPDRPRPRLLAFGKPGGVPWNVPKEELAAALARHQLVDRPPFAGPPIHYKSAAETVAVVDRALEKGEMGHLDFHGVGADWLITPLDWFTALLDKLEANREALWITDTASWYQYVSERDSAEVKPLESNASGIRIELTCKLDHALYDLPLTLVTVVPADWKNCTVVQDQIKTNVPVREGTVQYSALPNRGAIVIQPAGAQ